MFFPDNGIYSGNGHVNRLLSFAEQVKDIFEIEFLFLDNIKQKFPFKHETIIKCETISEEIEYLYTKLEHKQTALVLDGYRFDQDYQRALRDKLKEIIIIYVDDFAGEQMFADIVINHAPKIKSNKFIIKPKTQLLLGLDYLMLRQEFFEKNFNSKNVTDRSVFVCFGGLDKDNWSKKIVEILIKIPRVSLVTVVLGKDYKHSLEWVENKKINYHVNLSVGELIEKMEKSEIVIVPSSTMALEGLALGKKILAFKTINNQELIFRGLNEISNVETYDLIENLNIKSVVEQKINKLFHAENSNRNKTVFKSLLKSRIKELLINEK